MPIKVICPGCQKRFNVSEKFAGQKGPCPNCKKVITIPEVTDEEIVVHAPEQFGPADATGRPTLKPIERNEFKITTMQITIIAATVIGVLVAALVLRAGNQPPADGEPPPGISWWILSFGAMVLGPPLAFSAYVFLRDEEFEPFRGQAVYIRSLICGLCFAIMWAGYAAVKWYVLGGEEMQAVQLAFVVPPLIFAGAVAAWASFDLDLGTGAFAAAFYLGVTVLLRLIMALAAF